MGSRCEHSCSTHVLRVTCKSETPTNDGKGKVGALRYSVAGVLCLVSAYVFGGVVVKNRSPNREVRGRVMRMGYDDSEDLISLDHT